ncbi:S-layer homology domain-containing protein [Marinicrinis lubricantis]|uniref:S-layer homology domain-containing protein n=1 Tax=Marinicrinis lubricantis TaxID=2086470 RepID=A0ABW1IQV5_9BACL
MVRLFEAKVRIDAGGFPGVLARMQDKDNFYMFRYEPNKKGVELSVRRNNADTLLQEASFNPVQGSWVTFKLVVKGNILQGYVDGHKLIEVYDDTFSSGTIGFRNKWSQLTIDDVIVRDERRVNSDFENQMLVPWAPVTGQWSVVNDVYHSVTDFVYNQAVQLQSGDNGLLAVGDPAWDSYYVQADITPLTEEDSVGVAGRVQNESNFYALRWNAASGGALELVKRENGTDAVLQSTSYSLAVQSTYTLRLDLVGEKLVGYVNGVRMLEAVDPAFKSGTARLWSASRAYIDNVTSAEMKDPTAAETLAHWKFDPKYAKSGSLESNDLVLSDMTNNGNDLRLVTVGDASHPDAANVLQWSEDDYHSNPDIKSLLFNNTQTGPVKKYFETVETAPVNDEQFPYGYTMEIIYKLPAEFSRNTHSWMKILNRQGTGALAGKTQGETDLLGQLAVSNLKELQWTYYSTALATNPTGWSFSLDSVEDWYHIVLINDTQHTKVYVNGVTDFRNATQVIKNFAGVVGKGWDIGAASQGNGEGAKRFLAGNLEEIRIVNRSLPMEEWLIPNSLDRIPEYGNNEDLPLLQKEDNYNIVFVPDIQKPIRYMPEIVDEQTKWLVRHSEENNIAFTAFMGDIVDEYNVTDQWLAANKAITYLDVADIPYMTIAGNHDYQTWWGGDDSAYLSYFGKKRYAGKPYYTNESPSGFSSYSLFKAGSYEYMVIGTDWRDDHYEADRAWVQKVLSEHKTTPTILISHETLEFQGEQSTEVQHTSRGQRNWNDFVKNNDQVFMTVGGHHHGAGYMISKNAYGHDVLEILVDYQSQYRGGNGWMRFAEFDESGNKIHFHTFSPWVESMPEEERTYFDMKNLIGDKDRFTYNINFTERFAFANPLYYIDSGSTETDQLPPGEKFGTSNSLTDQPYGIDPLTGKQWGYKTDGEPVITGGSDPWLSVLSAGGGSGKGFTYEFEAPNGTYEVVLGFRSPDNAPGRLQTVTINGETRLPAYSPPFANDEKMFETEVTDGQISIAVTRDASSTADPVISWVKILRKHVPMQQIVLDQPNLTLKIGGSYEYQVTILPQESTQSKLLWSSSDESIAAVQDGMVVAKQAGTVTVTVTDESGTVQATATVTVTLPPVEKAKLAEMIAQAKSLDQKQYTSESWSVLNAALQAAEAIYRNGEAVQEQIDEAARTLQNSIAQLVPISSRMPFWPENSILLKTDVTSSSVELTWFAAEKAEQYRVLFGTGDSLEIADADITTLTDTVYSAKVTGLSSDTTYTFKVEAGNRYGDWTSNGPSLQVATLKAGGSSNGGGGRSSSGSSGTVKPSKPVPTITEQQLTAAKNGIVTVEVTEAGEIVLPANAAELLGSHRLQVKKQGVTLNLPSSLLQQLQDQAGEAAEQGVIVLQVEPIQLAQGVLQNQHPAVTLSLAGQAYELDMYWTDNSRKVRLNHFDQGIEVTLPYENHGVDEALISLYYLNESTMKWEYVGGVVNADAKTVTSELSHFSKYAVLEWNYSFQDVPYHHWAASTIRAMAAKQLIQGTTGNRFEPDRPVTRAEFASLLDRVLQLPDAQGAAPFTDVADGAWYADSVMKAYESGLVSGSGFGRFEPQRAISREEMAVMLVRAYEYRSVMASGAETSYNATFKDKEEMSAWAVPYIHTALHYGLMNGRSVLLFSPAQSVTRAEMAQALYNLAQKLD